MARKLSTLQIIALAVLILALINMVLFALRLITPIIFWIIIAGCAYFAYKWLPKKR